MELFYEKEKIKMECYHTVYTEGTGEIVEKNPVL